MPAQRCLSVEHLVNQTGTVVENGSRQKKKLNRTCSQPMIEPKDQIENDSGLKKVKKKTKKRKKFVICVDLSMTKYNVLRKVCSDFGFNIVDTTTNDCLLIWSDSAVPLEKIAELKSYQKINHFGGMGEICRKDSLARNIWRMQKSCHGEFNFVPQTWVLPGEYAMFQFHARELKRKKRSKTYIRKPVNGAMGHGIWLTRSADKINPTDSCIVQEYLDKPLLMDGYKFDLRMYVLVTSCDPLKIFLYKDGLVRMGTEPYVPPCEANITHSFMHLTNYSINKYSENFIETSESNIGTKRSLKYFWSWLRSKTIDVDIVWNRIVDVVIKTILVSTPHLFHAYHMCRGSDPPGSSCCFEVLGFDIFMDKKLKPWVLEVNRAPSFGVDQKLDFDIKYGLLSSAFKLLNLKPRDRRMCLKAEKIAAQKRLLGLTMKKTDNDRDKMVNKKKVLQKRKSDLKWRLKQLREEAERKEYEDKNLGNYCAIYPPLTKPQLDHYTNLLNECTKIVTGRSTLRKDVNPLQSLKEEEILDLLQEVENDVLHLVDSDGRLLLKGPSPLLSMPSSQKIKKKVHLNASKVSPLPSPYTLSPRLGIKSTISLPVNHLSSYNATVQFASIEEEEEKLNETLQFLRCMRIKFPGKSDQEAQDLLHKIQQEWKSHRPRVAAYWLVKLDSLKRKKVIDIVKSNVHMILQRVWKVAEIDSIPLNRLFVKLFNRLLWSHGQGLWNCFNTKNDSWESIFIKGSDQLSEKKVECCRQVVKLCCDCLLVVYQFASETRTVNLYPEMSVEPSRSRVMTSRSFGSQELSKISPRMSAGLLMGNKISKLYR